MKTGFFHRLSRLPSLAHGARRRRSAFWRSGLLYQVNGGLGLRTEEDWRRRFTEKFETTASLLPLCNLVPLRILRGASDPARGGASVYSQFWEIRST